MRERDREVGLGGPEAAFDRQETRRIVEKLLFLDELEDTLEQARGSGVESPERLEALERRVSAERETVRAMESRGELRFDEIARVMDAVDRSG